jgi:hypothetical protein
MPDAASDVKAEVEEDGDEPWQEVQNGEEDLVQPALLAEEVNNFWDTSDRLFYKQVQDSSAAWRWRQEAYKNANDPRLVDCKVRRQYRVPRHFRMLLCSEATVKVPRGLSGS